MSHTPGPWTRGKRTKTVWANGIRITQHPNPGCQSAEVQALTDATMEANANLIAAAPEALEALERARSHFVELHNGHHTLLAFEDLLVDWIDEIDKVLEKARGQA
jgi:hypothetical protein